VANVHREAPDDVDRLFARLEPIAPPADFARRVAQATYGAPAPERVRWRWVAFDAVALVLLALLSVNLGISLHESGALDLVALVLLDLDSAREGMGAIAAALLETLPWLQVALLATNVLAIGLLTRRALDGRAGHARGAA
jgi:hypothetical protein